MNLKYMIRFLIRVTLALFFISMLLNCSARLSVRREDYPTDLINHQASHPLAVYYNRLAPINRGVLDEMVYKPEAGAVEFVHINDILQMESSGFEDGFTRFNDGSGYIAVNIQFPGSSIEMVDWWFHWVGYDPIRYKIWYPGLHSQALYRSDTLPEDGRYSITMFVKSHPEGVVKHTIEAIAPDSELSNLYINFVEPESFGIDETLFGDTQWALAASVMNGPFEVAKMVHFVRESNEGIEMRSRFWMGMDLPRFLREQAASDQQLYDMAYHCAQEYSQLASFLPQVYEEYGNVNPLE